MAVVSLTRTRPSYDSARHMGAEQIRMAKVEAKRLPLGWFKAETFRNVDDVAGIAYHGLFLRQIDGARMGNFLISKAGNGLEVDYLEGGEWANNSETLGTFGTIADAVGAIETLIRSTLSGWGLQLAA